MLAAVLAAAMVVLAVPVAGDRFPVAQLIAFRAVIAAGSLTGAVVLLAVPWTRHRLRPVVAVLLVAGLAQVAVLGVRSVPTSDAAPATRSDGGGRAGAAAGSTTHAVGDATAGTEGVTRDDDAIGDGGDAIGDNDNDSGSGSETDHSGSETDAATGRDLVVLSFNTADAVPATRLARLVLDERADVVALPETSAATADEVARLLADAGRPVDVFADPSSVTWAAGTALLVSDALGPFHRVDAAPDLLLGAVAVAPGTDVRPEPGHDGRPEPGADTDPGPGTGLGADPGTSAGRDPDGPPPTDEPVGVGPTIVAVHPRAPTDPDAMVGWRTEGETVAAMCSAIPGAIVAGDLNATADHPALRATTCADAARAVGAAALGTWPARVPSLFAAPIDHVLVDAMSWRVVSFEVLPAVMGSDHRPIRAVLARR